MKRTILSIALALCVGCVFGQSDEFENLAKIKGVKRLHFDKEMFDKGMSVDLGSLMMDAGDMELDMGGMAGQVDDLQVFTCETEKASALLMKKVSAFLKDDKYQTLIDLEEDGDGVKIVQCPIGDKTQTILLGRDEEGTTLIVLMGKLDVTKLMEVEKKDSETRKMSLSVKTHNWEDDDEDEKEPRKYRDCLIVIDGKIYPDLHTQEEAVRYMFDHNMDWSGSPKDMNVLEGKDVKKKYPNSKKKMAFEYTTSKGQE